MRNLLGAPIGAAIDRQDGNSGIKGAIVGESPLNGRTGAAPQAGS
jgi:hypothetical protein